jgi:hypothetical protein
MNTFDAVMIAENGGDTEEETLQAEGMASTSRYRFSMDAPRVFWSHCYDFN